MAEVNKPQDAEARVSTQYEVTCKSIKMFKAVKGETSDDDVYKFSIMLDKEIPSIIKHDDETFEECNSNKLNMYVDYTLARIFAEVEYLDEIRQYKNDRHARTLAAYKDDKTIEVKNDFSVVDLSFYLKNAKLTITRTKFLAGDAYTTSDGTVKTHSYDGYNTTIDKIDITEKAQAKIDEMIDTILA